MGCPALEIMVCAAEYGAGAAGQLDKPVRMTVLVIAVTASIGLAWVNPTAAKWCWVLIAVGPWAANRWAPGPGQAPARPAHPAGSRPGGGTQPRPAGTLACGAHPSQPGTIVLPYRG
jgi:hypothetical protein